MCCCAPVSGAAAPSAASSASAVGARNGPARSSTRAHSPATCPLGGTSTVVPPDGSDRLDPRVVGRRRRAVDPRGERQSSTPSASRLGRRVDERDPPDDALARRHELALDRLDALVAGRHRRRRRARRRPSARRATSSSRSPAPGPACADDRRAARLAGDPRDPARAPAVAKEPAHGVGKLRAREKRSRAAPPRGPRTPPRTPRRTPRARRDPAAPRARARRTRRSTTRSGDPPLGQRERANSRYRGRGFGVDGHRRILMVATPPLSMPVRAPVRPLSGGSGGEIKPCSDHGHRMAVEPTSPRRRPNA